MSTREVTTTSLIENSSVVAFLAALEGPVDCQLLTEGEYVNLALGFASLHLPAEAGIAHGIHAELVTGVRVPDRLSGLSAPDGAPEALRTIQTRFVERLETIRAGGRRAVLALAGDLHSAGNRIVMRPSFVVGSGTVKVSYRCYPADFEAGLGFVLMLLLDASRPFQGNLCRCRFTDCQRYFLAVKPHTGRPRREYCSTEHLAAARSAASADRMRESRRKGRGQRVRASRRRTN